MLPTSPRGAGGDAGACVVVRIKQWCPGAGSNHRHRDFQSRALPTELPGLLRPCGSPKGGARGVIEARFWAVQNGENIPPIAAEVPAGNGGHGAPSSGVESCRPTERLLRFFCMSPSWPCEDAMPLDLEPPFPDEDLLLSPADEAEGILPLSVPACSAKQRRAAMREKARHFIEQPVSAPGSTPAAPPDVRHTLAKLRCQNAFRGSCACRGTSGLPSVAITFLPSSPSLPPAVALWRL